jgi:dCTP deaminase
MIRQHVCIKPFAEHTDTDANGRKVISYGLSSYGYDIRVGEKFKVFSPVSCTVIDPKNFDPGMLVDVDCSATPHDFLQYGDMRQRAYRCKVCGKQCDDKIPESWKTQHCQGTGQRKEWALIPPNSYALAEAVEYIEVPRDIMVVCIGKSTYARSGIICNLTPAEAGWKGRLTLEISNSSPLPAKIYPNEGIAQLLFFRTLADCEVSYADRRLGKGGKYQDQKGLTLPL